MGSLTWTEHNGRIIFSDGSVLPAVRGGSDNGLSAPAETPPEASPPPEPAGPARNADGTFAPSPAAGTAEGEPSFHDLAAEYEALAAQEGEVVSLPKEKIGKWNSEHKNYRERYQPYERAFKSLHPDDQTDILRFVEALNDPQARPEAVNWMRNVLDRMTPAQQQQVADAVAAAAPEGEDDFDPFDPKQVDARIESRAKALLDERFAEVERQREVERIQQANTTRAKELGYDDPTSADYALLFLTAQKQYANDPDPLGRAHEAIERRWQERATSILKTKRADAQQATVPPEGAAPSGQKQPRTMKDAEVSARQRLDRILNESSIGT